MSASYLLDVVRTPFGRYGGALAKTRTDDLAAHAVRSLVARAGDDFDPARIDDVVFGNANGAGEENRNVAHMATLLAGLPTTVTGTTINRLCGSSLDATIQASRTIECGDADLLMVGGVEGMSRAPWVLQKPTRAFPATNQELFSTALGWRMVNPEMPSEWTIALGESAEELASMYDISREAQDAFAVRSHERAHAAWEAGFYDGWVVPLEGTDLERDEGVRPNASLESLAKLKPAFVSDGSVTAGNASPLSDGAGAALIGSEAGASAAGLEPIARIAGRGWFGVDPDVFGIAPVEAANRALARAGVGWADVELLELNEAFASQSLACLADWKELDPEKVNVHGGAIALGHPLGASGLRILGTLAHGLKARGGGYGVAAICIGVGQGLAVVLEV